MIKNAGVSWHLGCIDSWVTEFEANLVYKMSSRTARATQRNPISKKPRKRRKTIRMLLQVIMKGSIEKLSDSKQTIKQLLLYFIFICMYVYMFVPLRSQRTVFESPSSRNQTQVIRQASRCFFTLSHFVSSMITNIFI